MASVMDSIASTGLVKSPFYADTVITFIKLTRGCLGFFAKATLAETIRANALMIPINFFMILLQFELKTPIMSIIRTTLM